jgi:hypothetical protein
MKLLLDTDIGSSTDDLFALEMLYRYEQEGRCQLLGVVVDRQVCDETQKMWDPMTVIQAVEGDNVFSLSGWGTVRLTPNAETIFTPSATGRCRYQLPGSEEWTAQMLEKIRHANKQR